MDWLSSFFSRGGYLPHGYCFTWSPGLLWSMVTADAIIALSYFSIPLAILSFMHRRGIARSARNMWVAGLFGAFIFACGITHVLDIWTVWSPDYGLQALTKIVTAAVSVATAIALWPMVRQALQLPSPDQHQEAVRALGAETKTRERVQEELRSIEQGLAVTLGSISAGFIATDAEGRVLRMNEVAEQMTGWTHAEAFGQSIWAVFVREGRPGDYLTRNPIDVLIERGVSMRDAQQVVVMARGGGRTEVEVQAAVTRDTNDVVRGMVVVFRDMTRLNQADQDRRRLASIVESSNDAIIAKTLDGRITSWNRAAETLFGYTAEEAIGQSVQMLIPPDRQDEEMRVLANLARGMNVPPFNTVRRRKDGSLIDVSISISPMRDAAGRIIGGSKIARDITPTKLAEEARIKAQRLEIENRQIIEANRLKSQFLANMSHELRTPLNSIIGFADLLISGAVPAQSAKQNEFLGHISSSGRHLLQLINDVLDLSKIESGKFAFFPEAVDLTQLIRDVCAVLHPSKQRKHIRIDIEVDPAIGTLRLDPSRLKQVLFNYLSNAIKFTPEAGRVTVRAYLDDAEHFVCEVEDTGIGIAADDLPRLFVDFQQLDTGYNRQHQGTGLGLALTRRLVEAQGGNVGARSVLGQGSVFYFRLRCDTTTPLEHPEQTGRRLLVIEHDEQVQSQVVQTLKEVGFQVDAVSTGAQALQRTQHWIYDAITLDLQLPDQRGFGMLASMRSEGVNRASPVIAVTIPGDAGDVASFAIADVLSKPLRADEVVAAMAPFSLPGSSPDDRAARVMVIDDDPAALELMRVTLNGMRIEAVCMLDGQRALAELERHHPDAIILDLMMPDVDGFAVLDALRRSSTWHAIPVFIWTSLILTDDEYERLAHSAQAILTKGGGALDGMLQKLSRWRPVAAVMSGGDAE